MDLWDSKGLQQIIMDYDGSSEGNSDENDRMYISSLESWLIREIIPKWPYFSLVNYYNLPRYIDIVSGSKRENH